MAANQRRKQAANVGPDQLMRLEGSSSSKRGTEGNNDLTSYYIMA